ncbi:hypothetical protein SAMN05421595_0383 [Austwickia chelonae]|uniref:hypothetical protein n=1 Tax=Austwickia chelonae TaxID=100225 RepID=UPI0002F5A962|nr:hypothetical protein [Austwickia chelonae]SEV91242.1 hypothetical protein SAMN05421595_0383 [Austwickia chelonae]
MRQPLRHIGISLIILLTVDLTVHMLPNWAWGIALALFAIYLTSAFILTRVECRLQERETGAGR